MKQASAVMFWELKKLIPSVLFSSSLKYCHSNTHPSDILRPEKKTPLGSEVGLVAHFQVHSATACAETEKEHAYIFWPQREIRLIRSLENGEGVIQNTDQSSYVSLGFSSLINYSAKNQTKTNQKANRQTNKQNQNQTNEIQTLTAFSFESC